MSDKIIKQNRGSRGSDWATMERCILLLQGLMRGNATTQSLYSIVEHYAEKQQKDISRENLNKQFENDRARLKNWFGCEWEYDLKTTTYTLIDVGRPLVDVSDEAIQALAFLNSNFSHPNIPMGEEIRALIEQIRRVLPHQTQRRIALQKRTLEMDLAVKDVPIPEQIRHDIDETVGRRMLQILYQGSDDKQSWWYDIEPERHYVKRSHRYLYARCVSAHSAEKKGIEGRHIEFRMDRIQETRPLPDHFMPTRPRTTELEYVLSPEVARGGVTEHFKGQQVFYLDDGSAKVNVASENLFTDLRKLLHYGAACKVIGGDEAVREMREIVKQLARVYGLM